MSLLFDGTNDEISFGDTLDITGTAISVYSWVRRIDNNKHAILLSRRSGNLFTNLQYTFLWISADDGSNPNDLGIEFTDGAALQTAQSAAQTNDGKWHHIAITYDGNNARFYFDGVLLTTTALVSSIASIASLNTYM